MGKYTRKNSTGDAGEYLVGYVFAGKLGWAYRILDSDTGIDGEVEIYDGEEPTGRLLKVQVKSTAKHLQTISNEDDKVSESAEGFNVSLKKADVAYWRLLALPVVLCVAHISTARVYFRLIDSSVVIPDDKNATFSVSIPWKDEVTEAARDTLMQTASLRDFNPLTRLLEQVEDELGQLQQAGGISYAFDKGENLARLRKEHTNLIGSIRTLAALGGWVLSEENQGRIDWLAAEFNRQVNRLDHESMEWENS